MSDERKEGYYWIVAEQGSPWMVGRWVPPIPNVAGDEIQGHFDCSNHWSDEKEVTRPYQVGPRLVTPVRVPDAYLEQAIQELPMHVEILVRAAVAGGLVATPGGEDECIDIKHYNAGSHTNPGSQKPELRLTKAGIGYDLRLLNCGQKPKAMRSTEEMLQFLLPKSPE